MSYASRRATAGLDSPWLEFPMIRLVTLGSLDCASTDGRSLAAVVTQPKCAGLFLYLTVHRPPGFHRRDRLLALLWPELDDQRGRTALRQVVYRLRQLLGKEALVSRGDDELRVDPALVESDVGEFESLLDDGRIAEAIAVYRGDFVAGLHISGASAEWEEWVERERTRLRQRAADGCLQLARQLEAKQNGVGAATWARRAMELAPEREELARHLLRLLLSLGDRAGALQAGSEFVRRQREQFGAEPARAMLDLLESARRATPTPAAAPTAVPVTVGTPAAPRRSAPLPEAPPPPVPDAVTVSRKPRRAGWYLLAVGSALALALGTWWWSRERVASPARVAVGEIQDFTADSAALPNAVLRDLLATGLAQVPGMEVVSGPRLIELESQLRHEHDRASLSYEAARLAGATLLLDGTMRRQGDSLRLVLRATDVRGGAIRYTAAVAGVNLFSLADEATAAIAERSGGGVPARRAGELGSRSQVAYRFYQEGLRAFYTSDLPVARRLFNAAVEEDSGFAMAWLYASYTESEGARSRPLLQQAVRRAGSAPDRERLTILAQWAIAEVDPVARAYAETLATRYPAEPASLLLLAQSRAEVGDTTGVLTLLRRTIALDSLGIAGHGPTCHACSAYERLQGQLLSANRVDDAEAAAREYLARRPHSASAVLSLLGLMVRLDRASTVDSLLVALDTLTTIPPLIRWDLLLRRGAFDTLDAVLERARTRGAAEERQDARWWSTIALRTRGRMRDALEFARKDESGLLAAQVLCESGQPREGALRFRRIADQALRDTSDQTYHRDKHRAWYLTQSATCLALAGDTASLVPLADTIRVIGTRTSWVRDQRLHHYVRGLVAKARGDWPAAVADFRAATSSPVYGLTRNNFELAGALLVSGRAQEAIEPLQAALRGPLEAGGLYLTRTELEERLGEAFAAVGRLDSARVHHAWVVNAWRGADPEYRARWNLALLRSRQAPGAEEARR